MNSCSGDQNWLAALEQQHNLKSWQFEVPLNEVNHVRMLCEYECGAELARVLKIRGHSSVLVLPTMLDDTVT